MVAGTSPYKSAKDLDGKTIACNGLQNISQIGPEAWLDKNGGNLATLKWTDMPFPDMIAAINARRVDAALMAEPVLSDALANGSVYSATLTMELRRPSSSVPGLLPVPGQRRIPMSFGVSKKQSQRLPSGQTKIMRSRRDTQPGDETRRPPDMKRATYGETLDPALMQPLIDATVKYGTLKTAFPAIELVAPEAR